MNLKSLARKTDLIFAKFEGEVQDRGDYITIKTRNNPGYHWGNYIIFSNPPQGGDLQRWKEIYRREFDYYTVVKHMTFTWDSPDAPSEFIQPFTQDGFHFDQAVVLTAAHVNPPPKLNSEVAVRKIQSDSEWEESIQLQIACRDPQYERSSYETFKRRQFKTYRAMSDRGMGSWFGAFLNGQLVGDLGIFFEGPIGRYQNVGTHPDFRRTGICGTLVYETAKTAFAEFEVRTLVMEADADYHAAKIYESVGFLPTEKNHSLSWWTE